MPIVTDTGFVEATPLAFQTWDDRPVEGGYALDLANNADPDVIESDFDRIQAIRIGFPNAGDGRGFSLAQDLRHRGYRGRLRAEGHLISDQYRYARKCGFDEVEISDALANRQPAEHWVSSLETLPDYRRKLAGQGQSTEPSANLPSGVMQAQVTQVQHYTERLFSFRVTRPASLRFRSGQFAMIGLPQAEGEKPLFRAYSIASPGWDDQLEFYSINVPNGPLTSKLQHITPGDTILIRPKTTGTLLNEALEPGERLWLFSSGTGIAPFASVLRDPETYECFGRIILTYTVRYRAELAFAEELMVRLQADPLVGEDARSKLTFYPTTTREETRYNGRITHKLTSGDILSDLHEAPFDASRDRAMICGSLAMLNDVKGFLDGHGLAEGTSSNPAQYVVERAFAG